MQDRFRSFVVIQTRTERGGGSLVCFDQEFADEGAQIGAIVAHGHDLNAVAGGKDKRLRHSFSGLQLRQSSRQSGVGERQALAHFHRSGFMTDACDEQFHCVKLNRIPVCATQVMAEQPKAAIAMMAAFRPRHPAETRRKIIARTIPQVTNEMPMRGSAIQLAPASMKPQVLPAIVARSFCVSPPDRKSTRLNSSHT